MQPFLYPNAQNFCKFLATLAKTMLLRSSAEVKGDPLIISEMREVGTKWWVQLHSSECNYNVKNKTKKKLSFMTYSYQLRLWLPITSFKSEQHYLRKKTLLEKETILIYFSFTKIVYR